MPLVKYVGNADASDGTTRLKLENDERGLERVIELDGEPLDLTDAEFSQIRGRYQVEEVKDEAASQVTYGSSLNEPPVPESTPDEGN